ncbi:MAG: branched-chain amino acid ABC transporter permease [Desulfarculaceae bacterium]|nr:branched-chain amino acid ABC transporter permease [Desulfarculaceae bacterium]MCF8072669.1 branched-chain amino acid ABC transporter permease [Desulfarculaceae bacterium]MCF8102548.1 branched-chain amino acid ABC transporter permease [Desulfarculaceae bacterium]MCF8116457.1 branched-chain amino acid ABC transporter permease [Desulfarculaceae bacterium]
MSNMEQAAPRSLIFERLGGGKAMWITTAVMVVILAVLPFILPNRFYIRLVNEIMIYGLLAMSLDVLLGYTGLLSFMHNAYLGLGAYATGLFMIHIWPESIWVAMLVGTVFTMAVALPVGWVQVRTGGLAFALLTLAFGMMFYTVAWKWYDLTGGDDGLMGLPQPDITLFGLKLASSGNSTAIYLFTLAILLICFVFTWRVIHSPLGAVLEAIRENEERASFVGINVRRYKLIGWMLACGLAGTAGSIYILYRGYTGPGVMGAFEGAGVLMMVLLGGMGTLWGPFIGAALFIVLKDQLSSWTQDWEIFIGAIVILLVLFLPKGVAGVPALFNRQSGGED